MTRIFITGSADGLGRAAAETLLGEGHEVIVHARDEKRLAAVADLVRRGALAVAGDLADMGETRLVAEQVGRLGGVDVVIHNAGIYTGSLIMPVNVVAPYLLTALIDGPRRLIYLSSGMHRGGRADVGRLTSGNYSDSKLFVTALAAAVARLRAGVVSNCVDPGWVPTKMGGPGAPDDLRLGHLTQEWLATSDDPEALTTGGYWHHQKRQTPHPAVGDHRFQDALLAALADHTGTKPAY
ncbi:SDR family NAD(P)-dependent oxidoreductase [Actinoplanes sichuanensis]|uniref:SDR family NAD(P)-dependent oxidoreductase n=1 Tax=Actinoplanes sichuanensis TaxID=512349 RepID=A0ABW4ACB4_9ACTN|nr:SDR family NAD(P)-dependent oxidoreductase [Actinoplanes sichuanensis]BEL05305.1 SDR family NAD(P)-dependent oxidoreductase [Actinoplanes sichuanensis]